MNEISPRNYLKDTLALQSQIEGAFLELGERLHKIRDERLYEGEYQNFDEFLLEAKLSKATASKLITVFETFVLKYKISPKKLAGVGWSNLYIIAPYSATKEKTMELVEKAGMLTREHLQTSLRDEEVAHKHHACKHSNKRIVEVCNDCSFRRQIFEK